MKEERMAAMEKALRALATALDSITRTEGLEQGIHVAPPRSPAELAAGQVAKDAHQPDEVKRRVRSRVPPRMARLARRSSP